MGEHAHLIQVLQIAATVLGIIGTLIGLILGYILKCLHELRADIKHEHDRFESFVRNENCKMHREQINQHMHDFETRIERALAGCKHNSPDGIG